MLRVTAWSAPQSQHEQQPGNVDKTQSLSVLQSDEADDGSGEAPVDEDEEAKGVGADVLGEVIGADAVGAAGAGGVSFLQATSKTTKPAIEKTRMRIASRIRHPRFRL
jgi:hypothetical protein